MRLILNAKLIVVQSIIGMQKFGYLAANFAVPYLLCVVVSVVTVVL